MLEPWDSWPRHTHTHTHTHTAVPHSVSGWNLLVLLLFVPLLGAVQGLLQDESTLTEDASSATGRAPHRSVLYCPVYLSINPFLDNNKNLRYVLVKNELQVRTCIC